jgi:UDP-N-acetylmuramyl pentapeptide phosphotransferase/UDP-N-acetylglucosamine-1-phosphate transferase
LGFFIFNFPIAKIFLGDGGAYWMGSSIAILSFLLMTRNPSINIWTILLINFYPFFETIFSIFRKFFIRKVSPFRPDSKHLHMMLYRLCYRMNTSQNKNHIKSIYINPLSSSILLLLPFTSATTLIVTYSWLDIQIFLLISLSTIYIAIYAKLNHFD